MRRKQRDTFNLRDRNLGESIKVHTKFYVRSQRPMKFGYWLQTEGFGIHTKWGLLGAPFTWQRRALQTTAPPPFERVPPFLSLPPDSLPQYHPG